MIVMSLFVTFEGGEGCGKSTQSRRLYHRLQKLAIPVLLVHEPGVTVLGKKIRRLLKWSEGVKISPVAELLMFNAARAQLVDEVIKPALKKNAIIICDRYADSTTAYQGYGRGIDPGIVAAANKIGMQETAPALTILLDMPVEEGLRRKTREQADRFQKETLSFHRRIREGYLKLAAAKPERWLVIDATGSKEEIADIIWRKISRLLGGGKEKKPGA
jgi:dTMP kinase